MSSVPQPVNDVHFLSVKSQLTGQDQQKICSSKTSRSLLPRYMPYGRQDESDELSSTLFCCPEPRYIRRNKENTAPLLFSLAPYVKLNTRKTLQMSPQMNKIAATAELNAASSILFSRDSDQTVVLTPSVTSNCTPFASNQLPFNRKHSENTSCQAVEVITPINDTRHPTIVPFLTPDYLPLPHSIQPIERKLVAKQSMTRSPSLALVDTNKQIDDVFGLEKRLESHCESEGEDTSVKTEGNIFAVFFLTTPESHHSLYNADIELGVSKNKTKSLASPLQRTAIENNCNIAIESTLKFAPALLFPHHLFDDGNDTQTNGSNSINQITLCPRTKRFSLLRNDV